jgi:hypothetical protein
MWRPVEGAVALIHLRVVRIGGALTELVLVWRHLDAVAVRPGVVAVEADPGGGAPLE